MMLFSNDDNRELAVPLLNDVDLEKLIPPPYPIASEKYQSEEKLKSALKASKSLNRTLIYDKIRTKFIKDNTTHKEDLNEQ